jgi:hypothetical protein
MPGRGDLGHLVESGIAEESHLEFAAFPHAAIFRSDRRLVDPLLEPANRFVVLFLDFSLDELEIRGVGRSSRSRGVEGRCGSRRPEKSTTVHSLRWHKFSNTGLLYFSCSFAGAIIMTVIEGTSEMKVSKIVLELFCRVFLRRSISGVISQQKTSGTVVQQ